MKRISLLILVVSLRVPDAYGDCPVPLPPNCQGSSIDIRVCGAVCDNATDDTAAINCALDKVGRPSPYGAGGGEVIIPPLTCIISPGPDSDPNAFLHLHNNLTIHGSGPKSTLKVKDTQTGQFREYMSIFEAYGCPSCPPTLSNVTVRDFRVDQNVSNNPGHVVALSGHDVIFPGVLPGVNRTQVGVTGFTVSGMFFDPTDSFNTIWLTNTDHTASLQATVTNNYFNFVRNSATPGYDVSTIQTEGSQQVITGNTFTTTSDHADNPRCAIETLSGRNVIANNTIANYIIGMDILPSYNTCPPNTTDCTALALSPNETVVSNNSVTCAQTAMVIFGTTSLTLNNLSINGNTIDVCNVDRGPVGNYWGIGTLYLSPGAANLRGYRGDIDGLSITNNVISMQKDVNRAYSADDAKATGGIVLYQIGNLRNVLVKGNIIKDSPVSGIRVDALSDTATVSSAQRLRILDNIVVDAGSSAAATASGPYRHAIGISDLVKDVDIARNMIYDTNSSSSTYGKYALYLQQVTNSVNIRTSQNTIRVSATSPAQLLSSQVSYGLKDATNANDVLISLPLTVENAELPVDFMSFTQYITTIQNGGGALTVHSPDANGALWAQWSVGQLVTFRFLCASMSSTPCLVTFDPPYAGACEQTCLASQPTNMLIDSSKGRAITFQVEKSATDVGTHKFFELYRTAGPVTN